MKKRHIVLSLLVSLSVITFLDRLCIAVSGPKIQEDLGISPARWGWVLGAFVFAYGIFEIPSGGLGDRFGQRKVLTRIALWWSAFTLLTGMATSFAMLLITQALFGAGEAGAYPNISGSIRRWIPRHERAKAQGYVWGASRIGGALAPLAVVPIQAAWGWRASFWIFGLVGLVWVCLWHAWYRDTDPEQPTENSSSTGTAGPAGHDQKRVVIPWRSLYRSRQIRLIVAMYFCYAWGSWFFMSWFPTYLVSGRGLTIREMGFYSAFPFLCGAAGNFIGGHLSDFLVRGHGLKLGRRLIGSSALAAAGLLVLIAALIHGKVVVIALLPAALGIMDLMLPSAWAVCVDVGREHAGAVSGAMNTAGLVGGFTCTILFGYIVKLTRNYNLPLLVIGTMLLASASLFVRIDATKQLEEVDGRP